MDASNHSNIKPNKGIAYFLSLKAIIKDCIHIFFLFLGNIMLILLIRTVYYERELHIIERVEVYINIPI